MTTLKLCISTLISIIKSSCDPFRLGGTACDLGRWSDAEGALAVETCRPCPIGHSGPWQAAESAEWCQRCSPGWDVISLPRITGRTLNPLDEEKKEEKNKQDEDDDEDELIDYVDWSLLHVSPMAGRWNGEEGAGECTGCPMGRASAMLGATHEAVCEAYKGCRRVAAAFPAFDSLWS